MPGCEQGTKYRGNVWGDRTKARSCLKCGVVGLRYDAKTSFCGDCWASFSVLVKVNWRAFDLGTVIQRYRDAMVEAFGKDRAAELMKADIDKPLCGCAELVKQLGGRPDQLGPERIGERYKPSAVGAHRPDQAAELLPVDPLALRLRFKDRT